MYAGPQGVFSSFPQPPPPHPLHPHVQGQPCIRVSAVSNANGCLSQQSLQVLVRFLLQYLWHTIQPHCAEFRAPCGGWGRVDQCTLPPSLQSPASPRGGNLIRPFCFSEFSFLLFVEPSGAILSSPGLHGTLCSNYFSSDAARSFECWLSMEPLCVTNVLLSTCSTPKWRGPVRRSGTQWLPTRCTISFPFD